MILTSVTTHSKSGSTWSTKLNEICTFEINQFALFLTGLSVLERELCFIKLKQLSQEFKFQIPFVHAVSSMTETEYCFLMDNFGTERFNLHPERQFQLEHPLSANLRSRIFIENCFLEQAIIADDLEGYAGVCLDLSHLEDTRQISPSDYNYLLKLASSYRVGANHISAHRVNASMLSSSSEHTFKNLQEFDYLKRQPKNLFSSHIALELENSIQEQLRALKYISDILINTQECHALAA